MITKLQLKLYLTVFVYLTGSKCCKFDSNIHSFQLFLFVIPFLFWPWGTGDESYPNSILQIARHVYKVWLKLFRGLQSYTRKNFIFYLFSVHLGLGWLTSFLSVLRFSQIKVMCTKLGWNYSKYFRAVLERILHFTYFLSP